MIDIEFESHTVYSKESKDYVNCEMDYAEIPIAIGKVWSNWNWTITEMDSV